MKIVVDTNIVFSGILSPKGLISDLLLNSTGVFEFYSPTALLDELDRLDNKLLTYSGFSKSEMTYIKRLLLNKITFVNLEAIKSDTWLKAFSLTENIDESDTPFVALSLELKTALWTGDKKLKEGLKGKGYDEIIHTGIIQRIRKNKST